MRQLRLAVPLLAVAAIVSPLRADEARGFRPDPGARPARAPEPAPLRLAEALSAEPLARLAPAAAEARAELAAMAAKNRNPRGPHQVGFARQLPEALTFGLDPVRMSSQIGQRVGGGFLSRDQSGAWIWGTSVEVEGAKALRLEIEAANLPAGARLWVYPAGGEAVAFGPPRSLSTSFFSPVIEGDRIHLELRLPDGGLAAGQGFTIRRVHELVESRGVRTFATQADACIENGECYDSGDFTEIESARDGVTQFFFSSAGGTYVCSGGLLDDNAPSTLQPWILTANHCVSTQAEAESMDMVFHYRYDSCGSSDASYSTSVLGTDLIVTSEDSDVTLLRVIDADEIPAGVNYLAWTSIRPVDGTLLHRLSHPVRMSDDQVLPQMYSRHQLDETPEYDCTDAPVSAFLHTVNVNDTGISGGSSGSPIFRNDGYVVGQLLGSCGFDPDGCGTDENVLDGAFAASYPLLRPYLSPEGGVCIPDADTACLLNGKFKVEVDVDHGQQHGDRPGHVLRRRACREPRVGVLLVLQCVQLRDGRENGRRLHRRSTATGSSSPASPARATR